MYLLNVFILHFSWNPQWQSNSMPWFNLINNSETFCGYNMFDLEKYWILDWFRIVNRKSNICTWWHVLNNWIAEYINLKGTAFLASAHFSKIFNDTARLQTLIAWRKLAWSFCKHVWKLIRVLKIVSCAIRNILELKGKRTRVYILIFMHVCYLGTHHCWLVRGNIDSKLLHMTDTVGISGLAP